MRVFFNDRATTEISTLSLHDALPIYPPVRHGLHRGVGQQRPVVADDVVGLPRLALGRGGPLVDLVVVEVHDLGGQDRKSTRLNSSHANISYAVFCLKKKNKPQSHTPA